MENKRKAGRPAVLKKNRTKGGRIQWRDQHKVGRLLYDKGWKREDVCKELGISNNRINEVLRRPDEYLTLLQIKLISVMTGTPFVDVLCLVIGTVKYGEQMRAKWFEEVGQDDIIIKPQPRE